MFVSRMKEQEVSIMSQRITIRNENVYNVKSYKYLGVDIYYTLSFDAMVDNMYCKANRKLFTLKQN